MRIHTEIGDAKTATGAAAGAELNSGKPFDLALGLFQHPTTSDPTLLENFANHVGAKTYNQLFGQSTEIDLATLEKNIRLAMDQANHLHVNLDGLFTDDVSELARVGRKGIGVRPVVYGDTLPGNITNWEISVIEDNSALKAKTTYYINGHAK